MANTVDITVKVHDQTASGVNAVRRRFDEIGDASSRFGNKVSEASDTAGRATSRFGEQAGMAAIGAQALQAGSTVAAGGMSLLSGGLMSAVGAAAAAAAGFAALGPALLAAAGAAGAAFTAIAGLGATFAVLKMGLGGIGDAFSAYGKSAGGSAGGSRAAGQAAETSARQIQAAQRQVRDANRGVVDSERALVSAKRDAVQASRDVNRAREDEIERLQDLDMAIRGESLSEKEAVQALAEAMEKRKNLTTNNSMLEQQAAQLDVERAQFALDSVRERMGDLAKEKQDATKKGVEGSDQVQAALERQRAANERVRSANEGLTRAHENVTTAMQALADAHKKVGAAAAGGAGGIDQFARAMAKLSPNAREVVRELISLQKRFHDIKMMVQDRLLDGIAAAMEKLADRWLPRLGPMLGGIADKLNLVGKGIMDSLGKETFIRGIEKATTAFGDFITSTGSFTESMIDAFGRLAGASGPVLKKIGDIIADIARGFDRWITSADNSGALDSFMRDAADTLQDIYDIGKLVFKVIGQVVAILFPGSQAAGNTAFDSVKNALQGVSDWLNDSKNQAKLRQFFSDVGAFIKWVLTVAVPAILHFGAVIRTWVARFRDGVTALGVAFHRVRDYWKNTWDYVISKGNGVVSWFRGLPGRLHSSLANAWNGLRDGFRNTLNWIISKWNGLGFTLPSVSFAGVTIGGGRLDTPNVPYMASGGIGGGLAMVGERGRELVRLPHGSSVIPNGTTESMLDAAGRGGGGGGVLTARVDRSMERTLIGVLLSALRLEVSAQGGNVQTVLGRSY